MTRRSLGWVSGTFGRAANSGSATARLPCQPESAGPGRSLEGEDNRVHPLAETDLGYESPAVGLHRRLADVQLLADFPLDPIAPTDGNPGSSPLVLPRRVRRPPCSAGDPLFCSTSSPRPTRARSSLSISGFSARSRSCSSIGSCPFIATGSRPTNGSCWCAACVEATASAQAAHQALATEPFRVRRATVNLARL